MIAAASYSSLDRFLHWLAFAGMGAQRAVADMEDDVYAAEFVNVQAKAPVFITSLPRAGTTVLLEFVESLGGFATNTYRDMPFVLCPLYWESISKRFRRESVKLPRAHGDGMMVGFDSPETFEEVIWKAFWPSHYHKTGIDLWSEKDRDEDFEKFFRTHIRKLLALRLKGTDGRYVSKNNANIARTALLPKIFADCHIVIPFRDPFEQAASFQRQHLNFLKIHAEDPFGLRYVEDIGHYEFGLALRPLQFPGAGALKALDSRSLDFWLEYWCCAFDHLLTNANTHMAFVSYDAICRDPATMLGALATKLDIARPPGWAESVRRFVAPPFYRKDALPADAARLARANALHEKLLARSLGT